MTIFTPKDRSMLLGLLAGRRSFQALVATWPNVERPEDWRGSQRTRTQVMRRWAEIACVPLFEARAAWQVLSANGFIAEDGSVDAAVEALVSHIVIEGFPLAMRKQIEETRRRKLAAE